MTTIHASSRLHRGLPWVPSLAGPAAAQPAAAAPQVVPTSPLHNPDGSRAGFASSEPSLYFLVPSRWSLLPGRCPTPLRLTSLTAPGGEIVHDLRLVLSPDYSPAAPTVAAIRSQDAQAMFFPLPMDIQQVTLFLPEALGSVQAERVPDALGPSTPVTLYYRLRFSDEQLAVLRLLAQGGLTLTGTAEYSYLSPDGVGDTAAPLTIILDQDALAVATESPPDPKAWLSGLLSISKLSLSGALDGPYALGGGITVQITESRVEGMLLPDSWALNTGSDGSLELQRTRPENLAGTVVLTIPQLGPAIQVEYGAAVAASLDLSLMRLSTAQLDITRASVSGVPSAFHTALLDKLMNQPAMQGRVAQALSEELQRRILSETLFNLGEVLP
jgi:hypothetical protein